MGRVIAFVFIAAVFPAIILADDITTPPPKPNDNCLKSTGFKELRTREIPKLMDCWSDIISIFANETKPSKTCLKVTDIQEHVESYFKLANETCPGYDWNIKSTTFMEMLTKTSENLAVFQKFYNAGCKNLTNYTDSCHNSALSGVDPRKISWYQRFNLHYTNLTCNVARDVKNCTITELNNNCPDTVNYVSSLFDVSLEKKCPAPPETIKSKQKNSANITTAGSSTIFLLFTMPFILVQYLLTYQS